MKIKMLPFVFVVTFFLSACGAVADEDGRLSLLATQRIDGTRTPTSTPSPISTPTVDEVGTALMVIEIDRATSTAEAAATSTSYAVTSTEEAKSTAAFWVGVTLAVATDHATETQIAKTETAGTAQAAWGLAQPPSQTALAATQIIERDQLRSKRIGTWLYNVGIPLIVLILLGLGLYWLFSFIQNNKAMGRADVTKKSHIQPNAQGKFPLVPEHELKGGKLIDPNLGYSPVLDPNAASALSSDQTLANTYNARQLEALRVMAGAGAMNTKLPTAKRSDSNASVAERPDVMPTRHLLITKPAPISLPNPTDKIIPLAFPDWGMLNTAWDGKQLPYGVGVNGLLLADPQEEPHLLIVGRTRSGKSRYGLRTVAAAALTMGYQVLFLGKRVDFYPFEAHPNAKIVGVDLYNDPTRYLDTLRRVAQLMKERDDYLSDHRLSIWQQTGLPQLYVVLDEFSSAVRQLNAVKAGAGNLVATMATALVQEGGKYGINIIQVVQDATGANVDISARRNMGRMVFRLSESISSDVALGMRINPDATKLPSRHFFTTLGSSSEIALGTAFAPSDDDIRVFLAEHPVTAHAPMTWLDGVIVAEEKDTVEAPSENSVPAAAPSAAKNTPMSPELVAAYEHAKEDIALEDKIATTWIKSRDQHQWIGWNGLEREIFGEVKNGARQIKIKKIVAAIQGVTEKEINVEIEKLVVAWGTTRSATEAGTTPEMPVLRLNPAS